MSVSRMATVFCPHSVPLAEQRHRELSVHIRQKRVIEHAAAPMVSASVSDSLTLARRAAEDRKVAPVADRAALNHRNGRLL